MLQTALLALALAHPDTGRVATPVPDALAANPAAAAVALWTPAPGAPADGTTGPAAAGDPEGTGKDQVQEISDAYFTRLTIHRYASYATVPLFVAQYLAGDELLKNGDDAAGWAESSHGALAGAIGALFAVNTVTGGLNWWETRHDPEGRTWRTIHSALMLAADGGFVAAGVAAHSASRETHRDIAVVSMGVALVSYVMMLEPFRR